MLPAPSLLLLFIHLLYLVSDLVHLVVSVQRPVAVMFQVTSILQFPGTRPQCPHKTNPKPTANILTSLASGSATPLTRASQRNRPAKNPLRIISLAPTPHAARPTVIFLRGNGPAHDAILEPQSGGPTRKSSRQNLRSATMSPVGRVRLD